MWSSLKSWITQRSGTPPLEKPTLLYTATVDGFGGANFHAKCDGKPRLLVIARNQAGYVFGGFSVVAFNSSESYTADNQSFLFSLVNHQNAKPAMFPFYQHHGLRNSSDYGPTYGNPLTILILLSL
jgi:hypothetical protein